MSELFDEPKHVIYKITNKRTGAAYIGMTCQGLAKRLRSHWSSSRREDTVLYRAMRKYKKSDFIIAILALGENSADLPAMEIRLIAGHRTFVDDGGYNMTRGGEGSPIICEIVRANMTAANRLKAANPDFRAKISASLRGRKLAPEHIAASARGRVGKPLTAEHREKLSAAGKLRAPPSFEQRQKIAAKLRGKKPPQAAIDAARLVNTGKKRSLETLAKIAAANATPEVRDRRSAGNLARWQKYGRRKGERCQNLL